MLKEITTIYHEHNGVDGYRSMQIFLKRKHVHLSALTVHHYMNKELNLHAIVRRKKPNYQKGTVHKVFDNLLNQDFQAEQINQKWATDFTYLFLKDGSVRYNCSAIDLHDYLAEDDLYASVEEFAYVWYNHVRPYSYNGYKTPFEARTGISNY